MQLLIRIFAFAIVGLVLSASPSAAQTISVTTPQVRPGDVITFSVVGGTTTFDWVALTPQAEPDTAYVDWKYLNGLRTAPSAVVNTANLQFIAPQAGTYNIRLYANNRLADKRATSATITVSTPATPPPSQGRWFRFCVDDGQCYEGVLQRVPGL
jgi:hypothetical protein